MLLLPRARLLALPLLLLAATIGGGPACDCGGEPPAPPPPIGSGTPIDDPVDAGNVDEVDAGPVVCTEDDNEDNDARADAHPVTSGEAIEGTACGGDDDWYSVASAPGCDVDVRMHQGADASGDVDLLLFDPSGQLVGSSSGGGADEAIHVPALADGAYAVRLRGGARDDVPYTLTMTSQCTSDFTCPADDAQEDNDDSAHAAALDEGVSSGGIVCGLDEDWFLSPVALGCIADARVDFVHANGDIDFELYRGDGVTRVASSAGTANEERLTKVVTEGGMAFRVFFFNANPAEANPYRVTVNEICAGQLACPSDDPFETNDDLASAARLFAGTDEVIGTICGDDDFYDFVPTANCALHITMHYTAASGDLDVALLKKSDGSQLAISQNTTDDETIDFTAPDTSTLALRVLGFQGATNGYRLRVEQSCP